MDKTFSGVEDSQQLLTEPLKDKLRIRFFSFAGGEFDGAVNHMLCKFSLPEVLHGHPVFREAESKEEFSEDFRNWLNSGDIIVLLGDPGDKESALARELVVRNLVVVSADGSSGSELIDKYSRKTDIAYVGLQQHLCRSEFINGLLDSYSVLRLGSLRESVREVEPLIREKEVSVFSLSAVRKADAVGKMDDGVSGLFSEEACQLCRYIGLADMSKVLWIKGFENTGDTVSATANLVGQLVWYFLDGINNRTNDYPLKLEKLVEIAISGPAEADSVLFYKSNISGRWWFSLQREFNPLDLIPCSHIDYQMMCEGEISHRIWVALSNIKEAEEF